MVDMQIGGILSISPEKVGSLIMKLIGPVLLVVLFALISLMTYTYFALFLPHIMQYIELWQGMLWTSLGLFLLFNILYNYFYCVYTGPGFPPDEANLPVCRKCEKPKPKRAHHCSVCNKCVLKMDHHCPWIMSCVGLNNHRYFVLFLFYLTFGCLFIVISGYSKFFTRPRESFSHICFIVSAVFFVVLTCFTAWHFLLVCMGMTTIEIFGYYGDQENRGKYNFSRGNWRKNMETVFGTTEVLKAVLPSSQALRFDGVSWPDTLHSI